MIDSLKIFELLKAHLTEHQARAVTQAIQNTETEITTDMKSFMEEWSRQFATKSDLEALRADLIGEIKGTVRWNFAFWVAQLAAIAGILKLLR